MRLAWHIIRKDLLRLRWILVLWAVVLASSLALATIESGLDAETYYPFWVVTCVVVTGFLPLFAFGLVMGLLHDDPVAEVDAFWITRPISGTELLVAKAGGLLLLSLVPVLVTLPFWLAHGDTVVQLGQAVRETMLAHFLIVAAALPFAMVSANGSKFVMNVMLGAGGFLLIILCLQFGNPPPTPGDSGLINSRAWLVVWLWIVTSVVVAVNQFLRRRLRWSLAAMAVAVAAGLLVTVRWSRPLAFLQDQSAASDRTGPKGAQTLSVKIDGEMHQTAIVGQVPLRDGASASHQGVTLKVQSVFVDYTGELQVAFSEAAPAPIRGLADRLPRAVRRALAPEYYLLLNPGDGVTLPVNPAQMGNTLEAGAMQFKHAGFRLRPDGAWQGTPPPDFKAWLQNVWLVKVLAPQPVRVAGSSSP